MSNQEEEECLMQYGQRKMRKGGSGYEFGIIKTQGAI